MKWMKELFVLGNFDYVIMYVCGLIVYNFVYIGNVWLVVVFDVFYCLLKWCFECVDYVCNFMDVDDKINVVVKEVG